MKQNSIYLLSMLLTAQKIRKDYLQQGLRLNVEAKRKMPKANVTIQARLKVSEKEKETLDDIIRRWSSCMRYAYKRLLGDKTRNELKKELKEVLCLNSRYVDDAILEAQKIVASTKEPGFNPKKVVLGERTLFEKFSRKHLSEKQRNRLKIE